VVQVLQHDSAARGESVKVVALMVGGPAPLPDGKLSAIAKSHVPGPVRIGRLGLAGDVQVDRRHHGGPEMAVHIYPLDHHDFWRGRLGDHPLLDDPGAFGGNLAVSGLDETQVRIGQRFRLGTALLEVSQPRMPCATIERRFGRKKMVAAILESGRCGWYFRVIEEGDALPGDALTPIAASGSPHTVRETFLALANPARATDSALLRDLASCAFLSAEWRGKAEAKIARAGA
jgi:MOSC domain-containing protein YiiM